MTTIARRLRRLLPAALFAAAVGLGSNIFGYPVVAGAAPPPWDIEDYDNCMKKTIRDPDQCCTDSGGVPGRDGQGNPTCSAPWPEAQGLPGTSKQPKAPVPTATVQPPTVGSPSTVPTVPVLPGMVG
jgi:hypothetical protein